MVDMEALVQGSIGFVIAVVVLVVGVVITDKLSQGLPLAADGNLTEAGYAAANGTGLIGSILNDYGAIIVIGIVLVAILVPLLFVLIQLARNQGGR